MSVILEALRKSEAERQREAAPSVVSELPPSPARTRAPFPLHWVVLPTLAITAVLTFWWLSRPTATPADAVTNAPPATAFAQSHNSPPAPAVVTETAQPMLAPTPPAPAPAPSVRATASQPQSTSTVSPRSTPAFTQTPPQHDTEVPDIADTPMPAVKLSMHVWDENPSKRFVILNGQRMQEGDRSGELELLSIDRKGVTIARDGRRAHVSLP